jgi:hypothetical protein
VVNNRRPPYRSGTERGPNESYPCSLKWEVEPPWMNDRRSKASYLTPRSATSRRSLQGSAEEVVCTRSPPTSRSGSLIPVGWLSWFRAPRGDLASAFNPRL